MISLNSATAPFGIFDGVGLGGQFSSLLRPRLGMTTILSPATEAFFDACEGLPPSGFSDVSRRHPNAGDIDCIAYYGIAEGTSAANFSPSASVTRQEMALFLTRLAGVVGIEMKANPDEPGFVDTADLPEETRLAIARLVDLGIIEGIPGARFKPSRLVTRAETALVVARANGLDDSYERSLLRDLIRVQAFGRRRGCRETTPDVDESQEVAVPFTDLRTALKFQYDAIIQLYELGVAVGTSGAQFGPHLPITRAAMAGFMAAVLDHSNARPAGLNLYAFPPSGWGDTDVTLLVTMRDEDFAPLGRDRVVDVFGSIDHHGGLSDAGECNEALLHVGDCVWGDEYDEMTDLNGNLFVVEVVPGGETATYYAWIGDEPGQSFDSDDFPHASQSIPARKGQILLQVTGINDRAATLDSEADSDTDDDEPQYDLGSHPERDSEGSTAGC